MHLHQDLLNQSVIVKSYYNSNQEWCRVNTTEPLRGDIKAVWTNGPDLWVLVDTPIGYLRCRATDVE